MAWLIKFQHTALAILTAPEPCQLPFTSYVWSAQVHNDHTCWGSVQWLKSVLVDKQINRQVQLHTSATAGLINYYSSHIHRPSMA